jgi:hypothetical protein
LEFGAAGQDVGVNKKPGENEADSQYDGNVVGGRVLLAMAGCGKGWT